MKFFQKCTIAEEGIGQETTQALFQNARNIGAR